MLWIIIGISTYAILFFVCPLFKDGSGIVRRVIVNDYKLVGTDEVQLVQFSFNEIQN